MSSKRTNKVGFERRFGDLQKQKNNKKPRRITKVIVPQHLHFPPIDPFTKTEEYADDEAYKVNPFPTRQRTVKQTVRDEETLIKRERVHPKQQDAIHLILDHPERVYVDQRGRLYGPMPPNPLLERMIETGDVDFKKTMHFWVFLPRWESGYFVKGHPNRYNMSPEEANYLPEEGEELVMMGYLSRKKEFVARIEMIPEQYGIKDRTGSVVLRRM
jgi:hypothetical protein